MEAARKDSWKTKPMGSQTAALCYDAEFSEEEYARIAKGLIPQQMEDKWFIYLDERTLHFHRSWSGFCIYQIRLQKLGTKHVVAQARANRDSSQYGETNDAHDAAVLNFLIRRILLEQTVDFPVPANVPANAPRGLFQHHVAGTGAAERTSQSSSPPQRPPRKPWWRFW